MELLTLGYVGIGTQSLADWADYGPNLLGLQRIDRSARALAFRMDDRAQRLFIEAEGRNECSCFGWEVAGAAALDQAAAELEAAAVSVTRGTRSLAQQRRVADLIVFSDPAGNRLEIFHGAETAAEPFRPGRSISGFRTGPLGLGHAVLMSDDLDALMPFYTDLLGFRLSDYALRPFKAYFFHLNARHHSLAFVEAGRQGVHHLMLELMNLDDVGQGYDLAQIREGNIGATLGRHTNDLMTSFYSWSPSEFMIEYGWGGRDIAPGSWEPKILEYGPSLWGHDRTWLDETRRAEARELRLGAARAGKRAPVHVLDGNHKVMPVNCPWWNGLRP